MDAARAFLYVGATPVAKAHRMTALPDHPDHLRRSLSNRHLQLIAIGGAIGTGLFMGSGKTISLAGPSILLVYLIILGTVIAIIRLVVPWVLAQVGIPIVGQVVNIILWAIVCIIVIYIVFSLLACLGGSVSLLPPGHR